MRLRNPETPPPAAPKPPDRGHVLRLVLTLLRLGAYDKAGRVRKAWWTLFDLVNVEDRGAHPGLWRTPAPRLVYHFRFGGLPTDDPEAFTDLLLAEFDEAAAELAS